MNPCVQLIDVTHVLPPVTDSATPTGDIQGREVKQNSGPVEARIQDLAVAVNASAVDPIDVEAGRRRVSYFRSYEFQESFRKAGIVTTFAIGTLCAIAGVVFVILGFYKYAHGQGGQGDLFLGLSVGVGLCCAFGCWNASIHCFKRYPCG